jgi:N-acetyl-anhydromuramyl-L-alanine amidase AmpD
MRTRKKEDITEVVLHCSSSDYEHHDDIEIIRGWHVNENSWSDVGYHYFITTYSGIQIGRDELVQGAGVRGFNKNSIHICLHGKNKFYDNQFMFLQALLERICDDYPIKKIWYHNELDSEKTCPNFELAYVAKKNEELASRKNEK